MSSLMRTGGVWVVLCVGVSVCLAQTTQPAETPDPEATAAATTQAVDAVLVTVNGHPIRESEVEAIFQREMANRFRGQPAPEAYVERMRDQQRPRILGSLVDNYLLNEAVKQNDLSITDEEIAARLEREMHDMMVLQGITREELEQQAQSHLNMSLEEWMAERKVDPLYRDWLLQMKLLRQKYSEEMEITDDEVRDAYEAGKARFSKPEEVHASHILVSTRELKTDEDKAAAREKIAGILQKVKDGEDFGELAEEHSDCPSGKRSKGDLGFFPRQGMVAPFADAAFSMKAGELSDIVETEFGYHIIKVTDRRDARTTTLEEAKQALFDRLEVDKIRQVRDKLLAELKEKGTIEYAEGMQPSAPPRPARPTIVPSTQPAAPPARKTDAPPAAEPEKPATTTEEPPAKQAE